MEHRRPARPTRGPEPPGAFRPPASGHPGRMQPRTSPQPDQPTQPLPIAQVAAGMSVADADGADVGTVTGVEMPGTATRPEVADDVAGQLMADGYFRIEPGGLLGGDHYAAGS